jgi:hypothetical protein
MCQEVDLLLHRHHLADRVVLDGPQLVVVDLPGGVILAGLEQRLRPQQAADMIGAERWLGTCRHGLSPRSCIQALILAPPKSPESANFERSPGDPAYSAAISR